MIRSSLLVLATSAGAGCFGRVADDGVADRGNAPSPAAAPAGQAPFSEPPPPPPIPEGCSGHLATVTHACFPAALRSNVPATIHVQERGGCYSGCENTTRTTSCSASMDGNTISLSLEVRTCVGPGGSRWCTTVCNNLGVECALPPLPAGTYRVVSDRTPGSPFAVPIDRQLVVRDDASDEACLDPSGPKVDP